MIAAFLLPFPLRGHPAPFLWVFYRLLTSFSERLLFIAGRDYVRPPVEWTQLERWEMRAISAQRLGYQIPTEATMARHDYRFLAESVFTELLRQNEGNPVAVFRRLLSERIPVLETEFERWLSESATPALEAVLTWCNCPSLSAAAARRGIPVVHLEMGPLRWPDYRPTAYLDFSGVNGHTEARDRYHAADWDLADVDVAGLRGFFATDRDDAVPDREFDVGIPLQVEDDSNLVAFGHGYDNQALLVQARLRYPRERILVRSHPGSLFQVKPDWYQVDASSGSVPFIRRCRHVLTINSSVGFEALLLARGVTILGDCSYSYIAETQDPAEFVRRLAAYLFGYLVPMDLIYSPDYLRFRLGRPAEPDIVARHLAGHGAGSPGATRACGVQVRAALAAS